MSLRTFALKPLAVAALLGLASTAHASFITYDTSSAFAAAIGGMASGKDDFSLLADQLSNSVTSSAGSFGYTVKAVAADSGTPNLFNDGGALSTSSTDDALSFGSFSKAVYAVGANLYSENPDTGAATTGPLTLTIVDATGSHDIAYFTSDSATSYFGIVSTTAITSVSIRAGYMDYDANTFVYSDKYPTVDNLTLAAAVPEPETYALMLGGLGVVAWLRRRQSKSAA